jgi:hypothetical protein
LKGVGVATHPRLAKGSLAPNPDRNIARVHHPISNQFGLLTDGQLAQSDQISGTEAEAANPDAGILPSQFKDLTGMLFIDYEL